MAADRTVASLGSGCVGDRHLFLAVGSLGAHQVELGAGMHIMAGQAGDGVLFTGMQIMEIAGSIAEAVLVSILFSHQRPLMAIETKLLHRKPELIFEVGGVRSMASEAVIFHDRRVDTLLAGLVVVTFVTDLGTLVLDRIQAVIALMVATGGIVAGGTFFISQPAVNEGSAHFAGMTLVAGLPADGINSSFGFSGRNV